jgi:hypothetical protein
MLPSQGVTFSSPASSTTIFEGYMHLIVMSCVAKVIVVVKWPSQLECDNPEVGRCLIDFNRCGKVAPCFFLGK